MGSRLRDLDPRDEKTAMDSIAGEETTGARTRELSQIGNTTRQADNAWRAEIYLLSG